jgi:hypothetical protein
MGMGGNAAGRFGKGEIFTMDWGQVDEGGALRLTAQESDWGRHVVDLGPIFAVILIIFRVTLTTWLGIRAFQATRRLGDPLALLMFAFVGVLLFNGQITGHGTLGGYAWLFAGFTMAVCREQTGPPMADRCRLPGPCNSENGFPGRNPLLPIGVQ